MIRTGLALVLLLLGAFVGASDADRIALVIGNAAYEGDAALAHSTNDATDVAAGLKAIGWKVDLVLDADRKTFNTAVRAFRDELASLENPVALVYYAGHGIQIAGQNYLLPVRQAFASPDDVIEDGVSLSSIQDAMDTGHALTQVFILDACRDNPFAKKASRSLSASRGLSVVTKASQASGTAVLFATAPGSTAADGTGRNGVFTGALLKYLQSEMKLQDVVTKLTGEVKLATGGLQVPYNSLSLSEDFYLVPASLRNKAQSDKPFQLVVRGPVEGMTVTIDGVYSGTTPFQARYTVQKPLQVELSHPDFLPYRSTIDPDGRELIEVRANPDHTEAFKASALLPRTKPDAGGPFGGKGSLGGWLNLGGWVGGAVGLFVAGEGYWIASTGYQAYQSTSPFNQAGFDDARQQIDLGTVMYNVGLGLTGTALASLTASFLLPAGSQ